MNEICVNIITRSELKGHKNLEHVLQIYQKARKALMFDKYSFFEPIKNPLSTEAISEIISLDKFNILVKDSRHSVTGSIWMNNRINTLFLESKKWNSQLADDLWCITKEIAQVIDVDFAFLDILTERVIQNGKKIGAALKTHKNKEEYTYSLFPKVLAAGFPDAYHFMLINKNMVSYVNDLINEIGSVCKISNEKNYIECILSEKIGSDVEEISRKKNLVLSKIVPKFKLSKWQAESK
jgi:hypothetical protein